MISMGRKEFYQYLIDNFSLSSEAQRLIDNILQYVELQSAPPDEQHQMIGFLLDGIGLSEEKIRKVYFK